MIRNLFSQKINSDDILKFAAPMVRYSRLPFRLVCLKWGTDVVYTPMFIAEGFCKSKYARDSDFTTCALDTPMIVQFATKDPIFFAKGASIVGRYCAGVDLNCGCPQKWANSEGLGAEMVNHPDIIQACIRAVKGLPSVFPHEKKKVSDDSSSSSDSEGDVNGSEDGGSRTIPVSIKIRLCEMKRETVSNMGMLGIPSHKTVLPPQNDVPAVNNTDKRESLFGNSYSHDEYNGCDMHRTIDLVKMIEREEANYLTIHGRTRANPSSQPVSLSAVKLLNEVTAASFPCVHNGDVFRHEHCKVVKEYAGVAGVMSARGILQNPALFYSYTPPSDPVCPPLDSPSPTPPPAPPPPPPPHLTVTLPHAPLDVIVDLLVYSVQYGTPYPILHNHVMMILFPLLGKGERSMLTECLSFAELVDFLNDFVFIEKVKL